MAAEEKKKKYEAGNTENFEECGILAENKIESKQRQSDFNARSRKSQKFFENREIHQQAVSAETMRWLTSSEAAQYLRVSLSGLKTMIYRGQVRAHKLGRRNRFLREELERLITLPDLTR